MTYEEFLEFVPAKCMYETIYDDSEGRTILVISLLDAYGMVNKAITALRLAIDVQNMASESTYKAALAQDETSSSVAAQQEPVAWMDIDEKGSASGLRYWSEPDNCHEVALYTTPPQRTWVGLTDEEVKTLRYKIDVTAHWTYDKFHEAIEAKLKEKNNGLL